MSAFKRGIYETFYGNAAYVSSPTVKTAFDLDAGERIPLEEVDSSKFLRPVQQSDIRQAAGY